MDGMAQPEHAARPLVTVVLVNRNGGRHVDMAFPSLARQSYPRLDVLVIDNGSTDGSCERVGREHPAVRVVRLGSNTGFSHALNEGIRRAQGAYILSMNFDVALDGRFVEKLVDALEARSEAGWAAGRLFRHPSDGPDRIDCNGHYLLPSRYCYGYDPSHPDPADYGTAREVFGASACAALYRVSMLRALAIDGEIFDEDLFAFFEDVDLDWRAQQAGYRCVYVPEAVGTHVRGGSGARPDGRAAALLASNRLLVMIKNDDVSDVMADIGPIVQRTLADALRLLRRHPWGLVWAMARVARRAPAMIRKRRHVRRRRSVTRAYLSSLRLKTAFLG
jgi:GT2 family glycosyltransferase